MTNLLTPEEKLPVTIEDEVKRSYLDYAMSVIIGRALPDVRDGLKPVHRRSLYGMWEQGNLHNKPYRKSARIVGDVLGKYHPHGESAVYDSVVRMAQEFSLRYPLVDGQGNFGSVDGDNAAAMRYTEVRLARLSAELLGDDIDKETVDWTPNYDGSLVEPMVLPAKFPNLLVNGSTGIAVGMATNIPPHNLSEVIDATIELIKHPDATLGQLMRKLPGPDFPTGAFIHGAQGIRDAYKTGRGSVQVRARAMIEKTARGDKESIVVTEIPYQVNKAKLIERIAELVNDKKIDGVADLRDESNREGMRIVVELKRGENAQVVLNKLYALTPMQSSFGIIFLAIVENQPRVLPLHDLLRHFVDHRKVVVIRRTQFDLKKAEERAHLLRGLALALANLDLVIKIIRASKDPQEARTRLSAEISMTRSALEKFIGSSLGDEGGKPSQVLRLDEIQAQAILDMRLHRLTGLEREKIVAEFKEVLALIAKLREILGSEKLVLEIIVDELQLIRKQFGDERRTEIVAEATDIDIEDLIVEEDMVITVSRGGYIKRSPLSLYRAQRRGGKGRIGATTKEEDLVEHLFVASTHAYVLAFTSRGRMHWIKVYDIPQLGPATRGKAIVNLLSLSPNERMVAMAATKDFPEDRFVMFATRKGVVKKTALSAYSNVRSGGIIAINLEEGRLAALGAHHRRRRPDLHRDAAGHGHPLLREGRPADGPRHDRSHRRLAQEGQRRGRRDGHRRREGAPALGHRERLRQALRGHRVPLPGPRRLGRDQRQGHREERAGRGHQVGHRLRPAAPDHRTRPAHPHQGQRHPRDRPRRAGRARHPARGGRPPGRAWPSSPRATTPRTSRRRSFRGPTKPAPRRPAAKPERRARRTSSATTRTTSSGPRSAVRYQLSALPCRRCIRRIQDLVAEPPGRKLRRG